MEAVADPPYQHIHAVVQKKGTEQSMLPKAVSCSNLCTLETNKLVCLAWLVTRNEAISPCQSKPYLYQHVVTTINIWHLDLVPFDCNHGRTWHELLQNAGKVWTRCVA